jgi:hypothetical protein
MPKTRDPITHPVPTVTSFVMDVGTLGLMGTISYIGLTATTPGWMILGATFAFFTVVKMIEFLGQFF